MHERNNALLIGISGVSSSGKTTLSRLLRDIFPRSFILHEDDFYKPDNEIPVKDGLADWDCLESIDLEAFEQALTYIQKNGQSPPTLTSKEDQNSVGEVSIDHTVVEDLKWKASRWLFADAPPIAIIDGFLLYSEGMKPIRELFDVRMFLRTDFKTAKTRREARSGYVTLEGFWEDPPGYVDKVVWPNYVREHAFMFKNEDVEGQFDKEVIDSLRLRPVPSSGQSDMTECLKWAFSVVEEALDEFTMPRD